MNNFNKLIIIGFVYLSLFSCKSEKSSTKSESLYYTDSIFSTHLNEYRKHNIYLPKAFDSLKTYPIIFATDGNKISAKSFYKKTLDSLIDNNIIKPVILVASHSNRKIADSTSSTKGDNTKHYLKYRYFEYINDYSNSDSLLVNRFKNHMAYFKNELINQIENEFNQKLDKNDRYFYGVSNGAGFGLSLLNTHPEIIGNYLCFSTFGGDIQTNTWNINVKYPNLYMRYGSDEPFFLREDGEFLKLKYKELNLFCDIIEYNGGHDYLKWNEAFTEIISRLLK
ncbi:alpha/beta hydrolase [Lacinutrix iliipiscaria]|uniref:Alpha/beta hydrolase n=1 Tax=Lacinutrix iliipiscaria TaxID=1230532 RepID=A0ABW5WQ78_9FLAO